MAATGSRFLAGLLWAMAVVAPVTYGGPGELDVRFASGGWLDLSEMDPVISIVPMPDGSVIVAGYKWPSGPNLVNPEPDVKVSRIGSTGSRLWTTSLGKGFATSAQRLSTGRILVGFGTYQTGGRAGRIIALREDGSIDAGFAEQGQLVLNRIQVVTGVGSDPDAVSIEAVRELPDGSLLVSAQVSNDTIPTALHSASQGVLFRLGVDGNLLDLPSPADPLLRERYPASTQAVGDGRALILAVSGCCSSPRGLLLSRSESGVLAEAPASLDNALSLGQLAFDQVNQRFYALGLWNADPVLVAGNAAGAADLSFGAEGTGRMAFPMAAGEYARLLVAEDSSLVSVRYQTYERIRDFSLGIIPRAQILVGRRSAAGLLDPGIDDSIPVPLANPAGRSKASNLMLAPAGSGHAWVAASVDVAEVSWDATGTEEFSKARLAKLQLANGSGRGTVGFQVFAVRIAEQGSAQAVRVVRSGGNSGAVEVRYEVAPYSSAGPEDVNPTAGILRWADGDGSARTIEVSARDDSLLEGEEHYTVRLLDPSGGVELLELPLLVTIEDDEALRSISAMARSPEIAAGESAQFVLRLERPAPGPVTVTVLVGDAIDPVTGWPLYTGRNSSGSVRQTVEWSTGEAGERPVTMPTNRVQDSAYSAELHLRLGTVAGLLRNSATNVSPVGATVAVVGSRQPSSGSSGAGGGAANLANPSASAPAGGGGATGVWGLTALAFLLATRLRRRPVMTAVG